MKRFIKSLVLVTFLFGMHAPAGAQTPSTEGRDFWVTFLRADEPSGGPEILTLTISAHDSCEITITNTQNSYSTTFSVGANSNTKISTSDAPDGAASFTNADCYSMNSEQASMFTALHVTSTKDISLFAGNYRDKSFDAANILPTTALLDDYLIQTYPPSAHADNAQGSHFAIVATEDNTVVDYSLTAKSVNNKIGAQTVTLNKGQVWYVWTGEKEGNDADLSGTTVKARNGKKIAVFQGCPHTNLPYKMRDRDHLFSQAMPTAYWGTEFGITSSMNHRRDVIAVMAINDGTQVFINDKEGDKILVHTFNFNSSDPQESKRYWTFEIGAEEAYSTHKSSPYTGKLPEPLIADSSCFLTTSCPAGVHLFMVSNTYDEATPTHDNGSISDPAMLWISPIEQVIREISFSTYPDGTDIHFMNIVTTTADTANVIWTDEANKKHRIGSSFQPIMGNSDYSFARLAINDGSHHLKGNIGFLAHVYGFGERCSYAYSCGSSTVQRSITFNGLPLMQDSIFSGRFCVDEEIDMKLNLGSNDYQNVLWDFGDGITYSPDIDAPNEEKKKSSHIYTTPGWYDLVVSAEYVNACTGTQHNEDMRFSFRVVSPDTIRKDTLVCMPETYTGPMYDTDTAWYECDSIVITGHTYMKESSYRFDTTAYDSCWLYDRYYYNTGEVSWTIPHGNAGRCDSTVYCNLHIKTCLELEVPNTGTAYACEGEKIDLPFTYIKGDIGEVHFICGDRDSIIEPFEENRQMYFELPTQELKPNLYTARITVQDTICDRNREYPVNFSIYYPHDVFKYKFNNTLAVYNKENNGGYDFTAYQWLLNGAPIEGATSSVYHIDSTFVIGQRYSVILTRADGVVLPSCWLEIEKVPEYTTVTKNAPATKHLINQRFVIRKEDKEYNIYGQRTK